MGAEYPDINPSTMALPGVFGAVLALIFCFHLNKQLMANPTGAQMKKKDPLPKMDEFQQQIKEGAIAFLAEEYKYLSYFVVFLAIILVIMFSVKEITDNTDGIRIGCSFLLGAVLSAAAGYAGMMVATEGNVRTTVACVEGNLNDGLKVAFGAGATIGFIVVGLGLLGISGCFILMGLGDGRSNAATLQVLSGFGFGASAIALFARVAGGIYTKAADVGADLVGKIEAGIDEDDPHNPAVIADNVGDNVGDVAGMSADLFESYVGSIIAAATLGCSYVGSSNDPAKILEAMEYRDGLVALPFWLAGAGVVCAIVGFFMVSTTETGDKGKGTNMGALMWALEKGMYTACALFVVAAALVCYVLLGTDTFTWNVYGCIIIGLLAGVLIGKFTEYFTSFDYAPVQSIKDRGRTGPATVVIQGLGVGMISTVPPTVILCITILACAALAGQYGVSIAAVGMLSTLAITLATDAYGPVADNAGGLAEMDPAVPKHVRNMTDALDALGNTTAATGKGFAIGSAVLTSLSLLAAFKQQAGLQDSDLSVASPVVLSGILFGSMLPFLFAALTMISVGKAAAEIIEEVRRQFREVKNEHGVLLIEAIQLASEGLEIPPEKEVTCEYAKCVEISTRSSVREMVAPGAYAVLAPLFVGFCVGPRCLMGLLAGAVGSGCMMAIMMSNAGGAWDNGKKLCEKLNIKKTDQGVACIVGDTVGDPFKDTSGPALNILIKLMSMISLTIAPLIEQNEDWENFGYGFIPLGIFLVITIALVQYKILTWEDPIPLDATSSDEPVKADEVDVKA